MERVPFTLAEKVAFMEFASQANSVVRCTQ